MKGRREMSRREEEIKKAISVLEPVLKTLSDEPESVSISYDEQSIGLEIINVTIRGGKYKINVACENEKQMVLSVLERVILKL